MGENKFKGDSVSIVKSLKRNSQKIFINLLIISQIFISELIMAVHLMEF